MRDKRSGVQKYESKERRIQNLSHKDHYRDSTLCRLLRLRCDAGERQAWLQQWIPNPFNWCCCTMCPKVFYVH